MKEGLKGLDIDRVIQVAKKYGIAYLALFGSYARDEAEAESDVDLAVRFAGQYSMFDLTGAMADMAEALGREVDLIPIDDAYPFVRESMEKDLIVLYEAEEEVHAQAR